MLGGGQFTAMNKVLPGTYINYVSARLIGTALSERGVIAYPMSLPFGKQGITEVDTDTFMSDARKLFGVSYDSDELADLREIFKNARLIYVYRLNGDGEKATGTFATAKYAGTFGNRISITVAADVDKTSTFNVSTYVDGIRREVQTVTKASELVDNDFVTFKKEATLEAKTETLAGGTDSDVTNESYTTALSAFEPLTFNALGIKSDDKKLISVVETWTKRMRDKVGAKFHTVLCTDGSDYEGIINVDDLNAVPWVTGADGSIAINKSLTNQKYDGDYTIKADYTQAELEKKLKAGKFVFHTDGNDIYVLRDINSLTTFTTEKNEDFSLNQVMRVLDEDAIETAATFNKTFLGKSQNDANGRMSFKSMLIKMGNQMQNIHAIENFSGDDITVERGELKTDVVVNKGLQPVAAMEKLYVTVYVS